MYVRKYVRVLGDDGSLKITTYHVALLPSGNKAIIYLLILVLLDEVFILVYNIMLMDIICLLKCRC